MKKQITQMHYHCEKKRQKKERGHFEQRTSNKKRNVITLNSAHQAKKQCNFDSGWLERQQIT